MSAASIQILHKERIPATGVLVIPGRLSFEQLLQLEKLFAGRPLTWLVEENAHYDPQTRSYLEKSGSGAMFSADDGAPASAGEQLQPYLANGGVLIYVPGRAAARNASACHIPGSHLKAMCSFGLPVLAVSIDCPKESSLAIERRSSLPTSVFDKLKMIFCRPGFFTALANQIEVFPRKKETPTRTKKIRLRRKKK